MKKTFQFLAILSFLLSLFATSCGTTTKVTTATDLDKQVRDSLNLLIRYIDCTLEDTNCNDTLQALPAETVNANETEKQVRDSTLAAYKKLNLQVKKLIKENKALKAKNSRLLIELENPELKKK